MSSTDYPGTPQERLAACEHNSTHPLVRLPPEILEIIYGFVLEGITIHITKRQLDSVRGSPRFAGVVCCADQSFSEAYRISQEEGFLKGHSSNPNWSSWLNDFCKFRVEGVVRYDIAHEHCISALQQAAASSICRHAVECKTRRSVNRLGVPCSCPGGGTHAILRTSNGSTGYFCNALSLMFTCMVMNQKTSLGLYQHATFSFNRRDHFDSFVQHVLSPEEIRSIQTIHLRDSPEYHD